ncbi:alanine/ornithine racemase family PLP-dependent enzyme [Candidatus Sumerlaeota bacterium]|nr:alanine/ornithine racemase family PLP-dependent enzyme [Candidatus Sumerlaeota bacterium]
MSNNEKSPYCFPRLEIDLARIAHNAGKVVEIFGSRGIEITGITKGVCGDPDIARLMVNSGIKCLGDSRIENIEKMKNAGVNAQFMLLRSPFLSRIKQVVQYADISLNSELSIIRALSDHARKIGRIHEIILMVELGDLREGIMPVDLDQTIEQALLLHNIRLKGIGTNLACLSGVIPDQEKMDALSSLAESIEHKFGLSLKTVSGGNSGNYDWFVSSKNTGRINNLRIGEAILLGRETLHRNPIPGLFTDAFVLYAEVIEAKKKPSAPFGKMAQNVLGESPSLEDRGMMNRALAGIGLQDVHIAGLTPKSQIKIIGATSDHIVLDSGESDLTPGQAVSFDLNYIALCAAMASPYVQKVKKQY